MADKGFDGFDVEYGTLERRAVDQAATNDYTTALEVPNRAKNRYSNVLPLERSRVRLHGKPGVPCSDYINANWVDGLVAESKSQYISTQGPLPDTVEDFWRMVWETKANVIVMLTKEVESDRIKCSYYWPGGEFDEERSRFTFEGFAVMLESSDHSTENQLVTRRFKLIPEDESEGERIITQFQYKEWPDHGLPDSAEAFRDMLHRVDAVRIDRTPIVVHCSAGIGLAGAVCTVHSMIEELTQRLAQHPDEPPSFNVMDTVLAMRSQRTGMVQTKDQYLWCYKSLLEEVQKLGIPGQTPLDPHSLH